MAGSRAHLRTGESRLHGATDATMTPVIRDGFALPIVPDSDIGAIAIYFTHMNGAAVRESVIPEAERRALGSFLLRAARNTTPTLRSMPLRASPATTTRGLFLKHVRNWRCRAH